ncbi:hypothetical protein ACFPIJ_53370 [Dactylosporangium cerinum]|uniref:Uncharacterized protein n=1 Tax=Dactylosporangium cerinum TaxID=1434730 RepID=A0ABV9WGH6_9ACTN
MAVSAAVVAVAAVVLASGTAMLAGAQGGAPVGQPVAAPLAGPMPVDPSVSVSGSGSGSAMPSPSMATPSAAASPFASGAVWATVNCAEVRIRVGGGAPPTDAGGPLVPSGATTVTRCETPLASGGPGRSAAAVAAPKVLTTGVDQLAAVLNALPAVPADQACLPITLPVQLSLVFTLPEQQPLAVIVDPTCSALIAGDRARSYTTLNPLPVFDSLYAAQPTSP